MIPQGLADFQRVKFELRPDLPNATEILFTFAPAPETPALGAPSKEVGDILFVQSSGSDARVKYQGVVSLGSREKVTLEIARRAGAAIAHWMLKNEQPAATVDPSGLSDLQIPGILPALAEGLQLGAFQFERYKTDPAWGKPLEITLLVDLKDAQLAEQIHATEVITAAVNLAREWGHEPANVINPVTLGDRIEELCPQFGINCTILDEAMLREIQAGGILAVGKGSQTPPRLIVLESPRKPGDTRKPIVLIGKALTFDSGGYSIKDSTNIQHMKYDKLGGVYVLAMMIAASVLGMDIPLVGVIGAAENMISGEAYRPDDIITMLSGKTVEIVTTDAEGRLVLADALTYAQRNYQPRAIIDLATLTGGVVVALGHVRAGIMSNDDDLAAGLAAAGERTYERIWRLPLDDDYTKLIQGDDADLKNSGGREGHPIFGGVFLKEFVNEGIPWAHLDIAGMADTNKDLPYSPKGATGFGIRLVLDYLTHLD